MAILVKSTNIKDSKKIYSFALNKLLNKKVVAISEDILTKTLIKTPVVKLKPITFNKIPEINSEKPIFFGVTGKKSTILLTKKIINIDLKLISNPKNSR